MLDRRFSVLALAFVWTLASCGSDPAATNPDDPSTTHPPASTDPDDPGTGLDLDPLEPAYPEDPKDLVPYEPGQTEFVTQEPAANTNRSIDTWAPGYALDGGDPLASEDAGASKDAPGAPSGRTGEVEEADIYRVDGDRLFYLNTYRGLLIYDIADRKSPKLRARLPVYGYPIEMFIQGNTVFALLRDALYLTQEKGDLRFQRRNVSQLVAVDISDINKPKVLTTVDITGQLREGVSRKIENTIYVVSYIPQHYYWGWHYQTSNEQPNEQAWVYSFNVAKPSSPHLVEKLKVFEGGSYRYDSRTQDGTGADVKGCTIEECYGPEVISQSRYFSGISIGATSNALMVVENWRLNQYVNHPTTRCSRSYRNEQEAVVSVVDISDPSGDIRVHTRFKTRGHLTDQFKQTYVFDKASNKGTYLGIFARNEWRSEQCRYSSVVKNTIESWDVSQGDSPKRLHALHFGKDNETVRGSAFDRDRKLAYAITARRIDPLYAISFANPSKLEILSAIDGLSGDMSVFRLIGGNEFLMAVGRDNSEACSGIANAGDGRRPTNIAVSIIDVREGAKIRLVQRECVAVKDAAWGVSSAISWNLDQAHKMIGMHSDSRANVITVPVSYYSKDEQVGGWWWHEHKTAVGLMSWDLDAYDPSKRSDEQAVLTNHGTVLHPKGSVRRSVLFTHQRSARRTMVNLSDTHMSLVDIDDLAKPTEQAVVEVAPYYAQILRYGDHMVEQVSEGWYGRDSKVEFRIKRASGNLEHQPVLARLTFGQVQRVAKVGTNLVLFRYATDQTAREPWYGYSRATRALVIDMTNPEKPRPAGEIDLPASVMPYYRFWCGDLGYYSGYWFGASNRWLALHNAMVAVVHEWDNERSEQRTKLITVELADPDKPKLHENLLATRPLGDTSKLVAPTDYLDLIADGTDANAFFVTYRTRVVLPSKPVPSDSLESIAPETLRYKYHARRWTLSADGSPAADYALNLPGQLTHSFAGKDGQILYLTRDSGYQWYRYLMVDGNERTSWRTRPQIHLLRKLTHQGQRVAELLDSTSFSGFYLAGLVLDDQRAMINARRDYIYNQKLAPEQRDNSDHLMIYDLSALKLDRKYARPTGTMGVQLMGTHRGRLFMKLGGDGIIVVDATNPARPIGRQFLRTLGWATHIEFAGLKAYVASGNFGISHIDLTANVVIPTS